VSGDIVETEAYLVGDSTSHGFRGMTDRTRPMFGQPGLAYVYFTYGMHFCMNFSTESEGIGAAVLIRALAPREGLELMRLRRGMHHRERDLCRGPGRLTVALSIGRPISGINTCSSDALVFVEDHDLRLSPRRIARGPRVGVTGLPKDVVAPRRFFLVGDEHVSKGPTVTRKH
jgi:DNA-3-methyladenine glycosylase